MKGSFYSRLKKKLKANEPTSSYTMLLLADRIKNTKKIKQDLLLWNISWLKKYPECLGVWTLKNPGDNKNRLERSKIKEINKK